VILRKNAPNAVRFHVNFSAREAKALFGRGFRWPKYRFSYRFARWRRDSGRERSKAVLGIQAVHTLGPGPIRTVRTAKDPAQSRPGTSTQWASGAGVQTSGFTADPRSSESLYLRFNRRLIGFGTLPKIPSCLILYRAEFKGLNRPIIKASHPAQSPS
jgi:hypothetical protein